MKFSERTNYNKIFEDTTWGRWDDSKNDLPNSIIENRNKLVVDYDIKSVELNWPQYVSKIKNAVKDLKLDHTEEYKTNNKSYLLVSSPYRIDQKQLYEESGWTQIYPIYTEDSYTFVKLVPMKNKNNKYL
jgi:hypothetical protein